MYLAWCNDGTERDWRWFVRRWATANCELGLYREVSVDSGRLNWVGVGVDIVSFCACIVHAYHVTSYEVLPQCSRATPRLLLLFPVALFLRQPTL